MCDNIVKNTLDFNRLNSHVQVNFLQLLKTIDNQNISISEFIKIMEDDIYFPVSIFNEFLTPLEAICKYLKENLSYKNIQIANILCKSSKSIWQAYNMACKKQKNHFIQTESNYYLPLSIFKNTEYSVPENVVFFLKNYYELTYHNIALLLKRNDRTIWTVYNNAINKKSANDYSYKYKIKSKKSEKELDSTSKKAKRKPSINNTKKPNLKSKSDSKNNTKK